MLLGSPCELPVTALVHDYLSRGFLIPNSVPSAKFQKAGTPLKQAKPV